MNKIALQKLSHLLLLKHPREAERILLSLERYHHDGEIIQQLLARNDALFARQVSALDLPADSQPEVIYSALLTKMAGAEAELTRLVDGDERSVTAKHVSRLMRLANQAHPERRGFFLKQAVAKKVLQAYPPTHLISALGYRNVNELLRRENIFEIFAALRFTQAGKWMDGLLKQYARLTPADFEQRAVQTIILPAAKWYPLAEEFIKKKYHNLSHSKEMGVIFLISIPGQFQGLHLRALALLLHYFWEVTFYSRLFALQAKQTPSTFGQELVVAINGDIKDRQSKYQRGDCWYILQRYLAKDPTQDWRFFEPHVMPEAMHWRRGLNSLVRLQQRYPRQLPSLGFWEEDMDWVAKNFLIGRQSSILTLNFADLLFSYAQRLSFPDYYLYHWRESFWNKLYASFVGEEQMEQNMLHYLGEGRINR